MTNTTSLQLSKQLYEKGLKIETEKWWNFDCKKPLHLDNEVFEGKLLYHDNPDKAGYSYIPAPSTDELLAVMPVYIDEHYLTIRKDVENYYNVHYGSKILVTRVEISEALGLMVKWLLENGWKYDETNKLLVKGEKR